ncbi:unknown [Clostridium sp. CAG:306]|nr:unknown [Clostridium sp. CAG:306]
MSQDPIPLSTSKTAPPPSAKSLALSHNHPWVAPLLSDKSALKLLSPAHMTSLMIPPSPAVLSKLTATTSSSTPAPLKTLSTKLTPHQTKPALPLISSTTDSFLPILQIALTLSPLKQAPQISHKKPVSPHISPNKVHRKLKMLLNQPLKPLNKTSPALKVSQIPLSPLTDKKSTSPATLTPLLTKLITTLPLPALKPTSTKMADLHSKISKLEKKLSLSPLSPVTSAKLSAPSPPPALAPLQALQIAGI